MASVTTLSIAEYLDTNYDPDREYIDGELRERNVGKWDHARVQWMLASWFGNHEREWNITGSTEQCVRVSDTRVRIPDLVMLRPGPHPDILVDPPHHVVEILSPDDTYTDTQARAEDYRNMGVLTLWIIDPRTRTGRMCIGTDWIAADRLEVPGTPLYVVLDAIFKGMGDRPSQHLPA